MKKNSENFLLIGAPNVGKSTFYNKMTWKVSPIANMDHLTTTASYSRIRNNKNIFMTDLPGVNSLNSTTNDENLTIYNILHKEYYGVINIVSATTLKRDLFLTFELAEAGILNTIVVNMIDELNDRKINILNLTRKFKVPVHMISAKKNKNISDVFKWINGDKAKAQPLTIKYNSKIEKLISVFSKKIPDTKLSKRFYIIQAINNNQMVLNYFSEEKILDEFNNLLKKYEIDIKDINSIRRIKNDEINKILDSVLSDTIFCKNKNIYKHEWVSKIDQFLLKPIIAIPFFILLMVLIYFIVFYEWTGGWIQGQLADNGFGKLQELIVDAIGTANISNSWWGSFVSDGLLGGIFTILSFLPFIILLIFFTSILEQIGLLSRMAVIFDKAFDRFGLSGRGIINLITGFGCNVPSIMMARNSNSKKERVVAVLISPLVSCSARIIVFNFIAGALFTEQFGWLVSIGLTFFSIAVALVAGLLFSKTLFRKSKTFFITEIPRWRFFDINVIFKKILMDSYDFIKRTIIIVGIGNFIIWFLLSTSPTQFQLDINDPTYIQKSFLSYIAIPFRYILYPLGLGNDWRFSITLLSSFAAKEIAASNIETLFGNSENFKVAIYAMKLPISTILSFLLYFMFFIPCLATVSITKREIGNKFTIIQIISSLIGSYLMSYIAFTIFGSIENCIINGKFDLPISGVISLFLILLFIFTIFNWLRTIAQSKGRIETIKINKKFNLLNYSLITGMGATIFINNILLLV